MLTTEARPRVAVVSVGAITAQGPTAGDLWAALTDGEVAIRPVKHLSMAGYRTAIGGEVQCEVSPTPDVSYPKGEQDRALDFALMAAAEAIAGCPEAITRIASERWALVLSTCNAGLLSAERWYLADQCGEEVDPRLLAFSTPQGLAEAIAGLYGIRGPVHSVNTACAAGANAVGHAAMLIRSGQADAVLTGGTDALSDVLFSGFNSLESLSPEPAAPYSKTRQGLSLGEGSGMLVLLRTDLANDLKLPVLAEIGALGLSADGFHPTAPHPEGHGAGRAIREALRLSGVEASEVQYVNSHGTGTVKNDSAETKALKYGLGDAAFQAAVSSTKSMIGHLLGAAGAVESIVTAMALHHQMAPPTANLAESAADCDLDYVPLVARPMPIDVAMCNNFAFGGANASLILTRERTAPVPEPDQDRVMITGVGSLTSAGVGVEELWEAFAATRDCAPLERSALAGSDGRPGVRIGRLDLEAVAKQRAGQGTATDGSSRSGQRAVITVGAGSGGTDHR